MNSNNAYANLLLGFLMLFFIMIFLGYQFFMIYEFSDVHQLVIYYRRQQRRQRHRMRKEAEQIQILLPDSSQEERVKLKAEEHSEINFTIQREEKDKQHKPEPQQIQQQQQATAKQQQTNSSEELQGLTQLNNNPKIQSNSIFSESEENQQDQKSSDLHLPTSRNDSRLVPDMRQFATVAAQTKIQLNLQQQSEEISECDAGEEIEVEISENKVKLDQYSQVTSNKNLFGLRKQQKLEHQKSILQDESSLKFQKGEESLEEMKRIEVSSIHSKRYAMDESSSVHSKSSKASSHSVINLNKPFSKKYSKDESESMESKAKVQFDSEKIDSEEQSIKGSESEFSKQHEGSIISSESKSSKQKSNNSVYIQPKGLHKKKKSENDSFNSKEMNSSSQMEQQSSSSGGIQKLMNKLSYIPNKGKNNNQNKKNNNNNNISSNTSQSKKSINQVYTSSFSGTHKTLLEKLGFLQSSYEGLNKGIAGNSSENNESDFSQIKKEDEGSGTKSSTGEQQQRISNDIIPILEGKKKLPDTSSDDKISSQNQSGSGSNRQPQLSSNKSRRSTSSRPSSRSKGSSNRQSRSSQQRSGSSKTIPSKPVNLSFIKKEKKKLKCYKLLFHDFRHDHFLQTYYLSIDFIRFLVFALIISFFYKTPKILTISIMAFNLLYLCYIIAILPFKNALLLAETIIIEGIANITLLLIVLYYFIADQSYNAQTKLNFGWLIIICNLFLYLVITFCFFLEIIKNILGARQGRKSQASSRYNSDLDIQTIISSSHHHSQGKSRSRKSGSEKLGNKSNNLIQQDNQAFERKVVNKSNN